VSIFSGILLLTAFFILFQWKNVKIRSHLADIDRLRQEILVLNAEFSQMETLRNELIKMVPEKAEKQLGMTNRVETVPKITINEKKLIRYAEED
jgi:hypothetical protein